MLVIASLLFLSAPLKVVVSFPGGPGDTEAAQKPLDQFLALWHKNGAPDLTGKYFPQRQDAIAYIKSEKPEVFVLSPALFLTQKNLQPIAEISVGGSVNERYTLVVKKDGDVQSLAALKGKKVLSSVLADPDTAKLVAFDGKPLTQLCVPVYNRSPLSALKELREGSIAAVLVDGPQLQGLDKLPFGDALKPLADSDWLPRAIIGVSKGQDGAVLQKALIETATQPDGKDTLAEFSADSIAAPDEKVIAEAKKRLAKH